MKTLEKDRSYQILREPHNDASIIFTDNEHALKYAITSGLIKETIICETCDGLMVVKERNRYLNKFAYRCVECSKLQSLLQGLNITEPKIEMKNYFRAVYKWAENVNERNVLQNINISKKSYQSIKKKISERINIYYEAEIIKKLGGETLSVQIDETAICHGTLPTHPTALKDDFPGVTWLVGMIEERTGRYRYEIVPNRSMETFKALLEKYITPGTKVVTDGHLSYPGAVRHIEGIHKIVNHSIGFKNEEGYHTNNIEGLWSLIKYEIKKRRGVNKTCLEVFLKEFFFRYNNIRRGTSQEIRRAWELVIGYLFEEKNN